MNIKIVLHTVYLVFCFMNRIKSKKLCRQIYGK